MPTLICDLDGVLFGDPSQRRVDAWREANGGVLGVTTAADLDDDEQRAFRAGRLTAPEYAAHLRRRLGWTGSDDELARLWSAGSAVVLEVVEVIGILRERGWSLVAADDTDPWTAQGRASQLSWVRSLFERVVTAGDAGARRPDPRYFAELLRGLPSGPRLYVDDDPRNVSAARRAGLDAHLFNGAAGLADASRSVLLTSG